MTASQNNSCWKGPPDIIRSKPLLQIQSKANLIRRLRNVQMSWTPPRIEIPPPLSGPVPVFVPRHGTIEKSLYLIWISYVQACGHCLMSIHCALSKRVWLHPHYIVWSVGHRQQLDSPFTFSPTVEQRSSLSHSPYVLCSSPSHPGGPLLDLLQCVNIFLVLGSPKLDTPDLVSQVPNRGEGSFLRTHCPGLLKQPRMWLAAFVARLEDETI